MIWGGWDDGIMGLAGWGFGDGGFGDGEMRVLFYYE